jgi:hypothetical protein
VTGLGGDSVKPGCDRLVSRQLETTLVGDVGVGIDADVRDGVPVGYEVVAIAE